MTDVMATFIIYNLRISLTDNNNNNMDFLKLLDYRKPRIQRGPNAEMSQYQLSLITTYMSYHYINTPTLQSAVKISTLTHHNQHVISLY